MKIYLNIWQILRLNGSKKEYGYFTDQEKSREYRESLPVCGFIRAHVAVSPGGNLVPCVQLTVWQKKHDIELGNVHESPLKQLLTEGKYVKKVCYSVGELLKENPKCQTCPHWKICLGVCRMYACAFTDDHQHYDPMRCVFFNKYSEKFETLFDKSWNRTNC